MGTCCSKDNTSQSLEDKKHEALKPLLSNDTTEEASSHLSAAHEDILLNPSDFTESPAPASSSASVSSDRLSTIKHHDASVVMPPPLNLNLNYRATPVAFPDAESEDTIASSPVESPSIVSLLKSDDLDMMVTIPDEFLPTLFSFEGVFTPPISPIASDSVTTASGHSSPGRSPSASSASDAEETSRKDSLARLLVYKELLLSEKQYIHDIETLISVFRLPLQQALIDCKPFKIPPEDIDMVFCQFLDPLLDAHKQMMKAMESQGVVPSINTSNKTLRRGISARSLNGSKTFSETVAQSFAKHSHFFKMASYYCGNHAVATVKVKELCKSNPHFKKWLDEQASLPRCNGLSLSSFLIKPVQRVFKYPLFFERLLKHMSRDHPNRAMVDTAFESASQLARDINQKMSVTRGTTRLMEISRQVPGILDLVIPSRHFIFDCMAPCIINPKGDSTLKSTKISGKKRDCWVIVFNDLVIIAKKDLFANVTIAPEKRKFEIRSNMPAEHITYSTGEDYVLISSSASSSEISSIRVLLASGSVEREELPAALAQCIKTVEVMSGHGYVGKNKSLRGSVTPRIAA